jgi:hypothetical protein
MIVERRFENLIKIKKLFWEVDVSSLDIDQYNFYIIERILEYGDLQEVKWMFEHYSPAVIKEALGTRRGLSKKSSSFWKLILGV